MRSRLSTPFFGIAYHFPQSVVRMRETWQPDAESGFWTVVLATLNGILAGDGEPRHSDRGRSIGLNFLAARCKMPPKGDRRIGSGT